MAALWITLSDSFGEKNGLKLQYIISIGGIMVIPVGDNNKQEMIRITKLSENKLKREHFGTFSFVPLKGKEGW